MPFDALTHALSASPHGAPIDDLPAWAAQWHVLHDRGGSPLALALRAGFAADRLAWAFAAGYQAALCALRAGAAPDAVDGALRGLCVTEASGNRPRDIHTRLQPAPGGGWVLNGHKRWSTLGPVADWLLVVALADEADTADPPARPRLTAVWLSPGDAGVTLRPMPPTPFVPEVPHAEFDFDDVQLPAAARVPGDAYSRIVKPFRTLEDLHIAVAGTAWLLREARARCWPQDFVERCAACLAALAWLGTQEASAATTHLALAGVLDAADALHGAADSHWAAADGTDPAAARWQRDRALFAVAGAARRLRRERAWQRLGTQLAQPAQGSSLCAGTGRPNR